MIEIKSRFSGAVLFRCETATTVASALLAAIAARADLYRANLSRANLSRANLSGANLSGANLSGANVSELRGVVAVAVTWPGHGECGRQLLAIHDDKGTVYHCGCFRGTRDELLAYIKAGHHKPSRTLTIDVVDMLLAANDRAKAAAK